MKSIFKKYQICLAQYLLAFLLFFFFCSVQIYKFRPTFSRLYDNRTGTDLKDAIDKLRQYSTSEQQNYKAITVTLPDIDTERMKEENKHYCTH